MNPKGNWKKLRKEDRIKAVTKACAEINKIVTSSSGGCSKPNGLDDWLRTLRAVIGSGNAFHELPILEARCAAYFSQRPVKQLEELRLIQLEILQSLNDVEHHLTEED